MSVIVVRITNNVYSWSYLMSDCQGIMAIVVAVCSFMYFKNLRIRQNRIINTIAASCFGVLQIHTNSDSMRQWLWYDIVNVREYFTEDGFSWKIIVSISIIYVSCTIIDYIRIQHIETPVFKILDNKLVTYRWWK